MIALCSELISTLVRDLSFSVFIDVLSVEMLKPFDFLGFRKLEVRGVDGDFSHGSTYT